MSYYYVTEIYTHKMRIHNEYSVNVQTKAQWLLGIDTYTERIKQYDDFGLKWNILSCKFGHLPVGYMGNYLIMKYVK